MKTNLLKTVLSLLTIFCTMACLTAQNRHPYDPVSIPSNLENLRPGQIMDAVTKGFNVILPVGSMESSGNDLPVGLLSSKAHDALDSLSKKTNSVIAPPVWYSPTGYLHGAPTDGTFDIPVQPFLLYLEETITELHRMGFSKVHLVIMHDSQKEKSLLHAACRFALGDLFNNYWKDSTAGIGWWINPKVKTMAWEKDNLIYLDIKSLNIKKSTASFRLEEMTPDEIKKAVARGLPCFVPVGVIENHGNHNPVGCDAIEAQDPLLKAVAEEPAVIAPTIWYGGTAYAVSGPELGTIDINGQTFYRYASGVADGLAAIGFKHVIFVQSHQGGGAENTSLPLIALESLRKITNRPEAGPGWMDKPDKREAFNPVVEAISPPSGTYKGPIYDHAGKNETSWMLYLRPQYTDLKLIQPGDYPFCWYKNDESKAATFEQGKEMADAQIEAWIKIIRGKTINKSK